MRPYTKKGRALVTNCLGLCLDPLCVARQFVKSLKQRGSARADSFYRSTDGGFVTRLTSKGFECSHAFLKTRQWPGFFALVWHIQTPPFTGLNGVWFGVQKVPVFGALPGDW